MKSIFKNILQSLKMLGVELPNGLTLNGITIENRNWKLKSKMENGIKTNINANACSFALFTFYIR